MASASELIVTVSADTSALEADLADAEAAILVVLRRQYIAEGGPHGATPAGFETWIAKREALIRLTLEVAGMPPAPAPPPLLDRFQAQLDRMRKGPPGDAGDCEFCHPELAGKE